MNPEKPHDKFFRDTFSRIDITADFLQAYLPASLLARLDLTSLQREADTYTDEALSEHFADLVFSVGIGNQAALVTLLLEHKSYPVQQPHLQLHRYMVNVWEQQVRQEKPLTPILPVIIYHGRSRWPIRSFPAYFPGIPNELLPYLPAFDYVLIDLGTIETKLPLLRSDYARLTGLLLQNSRQKRALERVLLAYAQLFRNVVETEQGRAFIGTAVLYLSFASQLTRIEMIAIFEQVSTKAAETAMTAAQEWINEGIEKGIERGVAQGIERGVRGMLKLGMDAPAVAAAMEIPQTVVDQIIQKIRQEQ